MNALMRRGLRFTRFHPEAMPTVPFRNSLLSGRRTWPWRGWHDWPGLLDAPGWQPIEGVRSSLLPALRRAGYWTGYVTDNPFLGFAPPYRRLRSRVDRFTARGGQLGGSGRGVPDRELYHWLHPALQADAKIRTRVRKFLASADEYWRDESRSFAARVYRSGVEALNVAAAPAPVRAGGGHLRAARAVDPAAQVHRPLRRPPLSRPRAGHAALRQDRLLRPGPRAGPAARADARALRGRGHDDRPLDGGAHRPPPRPPARPRDDRGARERPRLLPRRARLDREDLERAAPGADPHAARDRGPGRPALGRRDRLPGAEPRRGAHDPLDGRRARARGHERHRPVADVPREPPARPAGLRRLRQQPVRLRRALEADRRQPRGRPPPLRHEARSGRGPRRVAPAPRPHVGDVRRRGPEGRRAGCRTT